ncbi:MAG: hypothetical protein PVG79_02085 [Gemmatimonadales bacterium]|jgi:hypothetical protein
MLLRCPHCKRAGEHVRSDFFGDWVVCSVCELPFAWREARTEDDAEQARTNGNGRRALEREPSRTRDER